MYKSLAQKDTQRDQLHWCEITMNKNQMVTKLLLCGLLVKRDAVTEWLF